MRFTENCIVIPLENVFTTMSFDEALHLFVELISLSKKIPLFIAMKPCIVTTSIRNIKRRIGISIGSMVICNNLDVVEKHCNRVNCIRLVEPEWIDVNIFCPYIDREGSTCIEILNKMLNLSLPLIVRNDIYTYLRCTEAHNKDLESRLRDIVESGLLLYYIDRAPYMDRLRCSITPAPSTHPLIAIHRILSTISGIVELKVYLDTDRIPKRLRPLSEPLLYVGRIPLVYAIGKGIVLNYSPICSVSRVLTLLITIYALSLNTTTPRGQALLRYVYKTSVQL